MANIPDVEEMTADQRRIVIDAVQIYEAYQDALQKAESYKGGMHWKRSKGRQYLFRKLDRLGHGKSLGPRSPDTEKIIDAFQGGKKESKDRIRSLKERLSEQSRFCKAAMVHRVPTVVAKILRQLDSYGLLGNRLIVIGTNALYAYEAAAGVFFEKPIMATEDMDIMFDVRSGVSLSGDDAEEIGLLDILRKADSSFSLVQAGDFRAVNKRGYLVDLIRPMPSSPRKVQPRSVGGIDDMQAVDTRKLDWLVSAPKLSQVVIGQDGFPAPMVVPDPRAFVIHKLWLSRQEDRQPTKKPRDRMQAMAAAKLVRQYLPQYKFVSSELRTFPKDIVEEVLGELKKPGEF